MGSSASHRPVAADPYREAQDGLHPVQNPIGHLDISGDLAAELAEVMVHRGGIADRHDQAGTARTSPAGALIPYFGEYAIMTSELVSGPRIPSVSSEPRL